MRLVSCLVCSPCPSSFLTVPLSVRGETRIKQLPKTAQKVKTQPNGFARKRNKTTQRNEMSKLRFQVLATAGLLLPPTPTANHIRKPRTTAQPPTHTHSCCVLPWQRVSLCHFLQFARKTTLVVKIFKTCCILLGGRCEEAIGLRVLCHCMETLLKHLIDFYTRTTTATTTSPKSFSLLITGSNGRLTFLIALKKLCVPVKYIAYTTRHLPFLHAHARTTHPRTYTHTHKGVCRINV